MHGSIFVELREYLGASFGDEHWPAVLSAAQIAHTDYDASRIYPDLEAVRIVAAAADHTGRPLHELLESFGEYLAGSLITRYAMLVDPKWRTLDLLEHVEETIHTVIRAGDSAADPPRVVTHRTSPIDIVIHYASSRRMCSLAKGLIRGVAGYYREAVSLSESACMLRGDDHCEIHVRKER